MTENKLNKVPKRLLYFSDGILEEYSSEDEVDNENVSNQPLVDPVSFLVKLITLFWIFNLFLY